MTSQIEENIHTYVDKLKYLQHTVLKYLDTPGDSESDYHDIIEYFEEQKIHQNRNELESILRLLLKISNEHHREATFYPKIEKILLVFKEDIKIFHSNYEIFQIFKSNKRLLLFLIKEGFITADKAIACSISCLKYKQAKYPHYFLPEFKPFFDDILLQQIHEDIQKLNHDQPLSEDDPAFDLKRRNGENDNKICELIRKDSVDEFNEFVNHSNLPHTSTIEPSIFETNPFLVNKTPSLIEYAAFCGSVNIFNFLKENLVQLTPSLWIYSIHGNKSEIIKVLDENNIKPEDESFRDVFVEAIKCHHNSIANSILNDKIKNKISIVQKATQAIIKYSNYSFFPEKFKLNEVRPFSDFCKYNYYYIVKTLLNAENLPINSQDVIFPFF